MKFTFSFICSVVFLLVLSSNVFSQDDTPPDTIYETQTIEVDATRGIEGTTPITLENIDRTEIENYYWMEDLPMFLNGKTSINAYSESGASIGYSYFTIRGFDQRRISILIDGIPQNDPEDHQVYWVDISDLTASVQDIQIQRGIGTALYGSSSIGGVVNIQTINPFTNRFMKATGGYGDYNSHRYSMEFSSGMINNEYGFYGKFAKTKTDGYRDLSWSDHWSYFLIAGKMFGKSSVLKFTTYGGPIKNHLAYLGVTRDYLDGKISGDPRVDRRVNFLDFPNETDNYNQPHYELVFNTQPSKDLYISNTLSYIRGDGYFVTNFPTYYGLDFDYFRLPSFFTTDSTTYNPDCYRRNPDGSLYFEPGRGYEIVRSNLVTNLYVNNDTYGWFPKIKWTHNKGKADLVFGGEVRYHRSEHYGEVTFGDALPPGTPDNYRYYFYNGVKNTYSVYANEIYRFTPKLTAMAGVQFVYHKYAIENDQYKPYNFDVDYNFFTPRVGVNYDLTDYLRVFGNFSMAKREPRLKDIYDAESPYSTPNFRVVDPVNGIYEDPLVKPEEMNDYELGFGLELNDLKADLNFYLMDFNNEIVNNGQLDNVGQPIVGNAGKSIHRGIELQAAYRPFKKMFGDRSLGPLTLEGNLNISDNYFTEYIEVLGADSLGNIIYGNDYSDNKILLNPGIIANLQLSYSSQNGIGAFIAMQHIGKQYLDNSENERKNPDARNQPGYVDKVIEPYMVVNAGLSFNLVPIIGQKHFGNFLKQLEANFRVNNLFDALYETTGSVDGSGTPYWIPAAERNFYFDIRVGL